MLSCVRSNGRPCNLFRKWQSLLQYLSRSARLWTFSNGVSLISIPTVPRESWELGVLKKSNTEEGETQVVLTSDFLNASNTSKEKLSRLNPVWIRISPRSRSPCLLCLLALPTLSMLLKNAWSFPLPVGGNHLSWIKRSGSVLCEAQRTTGKSRSRFSSMPLYTDLTSVFQWEPGPSNCGNKFSKRLTLSSRSSSRHLRFTDSFAMNGNW